MSASASRRIAVAGATGTVGCHVVEAARLRGHEVVSISRASGVDVVSGTLRDRLDGVDAIIDVLSVPTLSRKRATEFFRSAGATLQRDGRAAGVSHLVTLSIVGIDGVEDSYYGAKLSQEMAVREGALPWSLLRAAQFHEFAAQTIDRGSLGPVVMVPKAPIRPVSAREVAEELVRLAEGAPAGRAPDLTGPRDERLVDMVRAVLRAQGSRRPAFEIALPGGMGAAMAAGRMRGDETARRGTLTFSEWLARS